MSKDFLPIKDINKRLLLVKFETVENRSDSKSESNIGADRATLAGMSNENGLLIFNDLILYLSNAIFPEESESVLRFLIASIILNLSAF